ncbi:MAG: L-histidine N(alpha)-methyltransferase [Acidobacteriia bacterium]|nr:L-histidine N(alpha)-methyltransferase [Terriglobia bacterium]
MNIEVFLTEAEIAQEFAESIEARDLPEKFFYWFPRSVRAWLDISQNSTASCFRQCWENVSDHAQNLAANADSTVSVISFGSGDGAKDRLLIKALEHAGRNVKYFPVDASQTLLELACSAAEDAEIETMGIKADISSPMHLVLASDAAESPKTFLVAGNTLGGFDPLDQVRHLAECMHSSDRLIIDGEIFHEAVLARGEDPATRRFALAPLATVGVAEDDGELRFEHKRDDRHNGLHLVTRFFRADRDLTLGVPGEPTLPRGERVFLNFRYTYTPEAFRWLLAKHAGLKILEEIVSSDGYCILAVCSR